MSTTPDPWRADWAPADAVAVYDAARYSGPGADGAGTLTRVPDLVVRPDGLDRSFRLPAGSAEHVAHDAALGRAAFVLRGTDELRADSVTTAGWLGGSAEAWAWSAYLRVENGHPVRLWLGVTSFVFLDVLDNRWKYQYGGSVSQTTYTFGPNPAAPGAPVVVTWHRSPAMGGAAAYNRLLVNGVEVGRTIPNTWLDHPRIAPYYKGGTWAVPADAVLHLSEVVATGYPAGSPPTSGEVQAHHDALVAKYGL